MPEELDDFDWESLAEFFVFEFGATAREDTQREDNEEGDWTT